MQGLGDPWLMVTIHNPLDTQPSLNPTILRGAFKPSQITDFINREAIEHAGGRPQPLADEEGMSPREVVRCVLSLGMYLSAYPEAQSSGLPGWMKSKHPDGRKGVPFAHIGYNLEDRELKAAMTTPRTVHRTGGRCATSASTAARGPTTDVHTGQRLRGGYKQNHSSGCCRNVSLYLN